MKHTGKLTALAALLVALSACSGTTTDDVAETNDTAANDTTTVIEEEESGMFTSRDLEIGWDEQTAVRITLTGSSASSDSAAVAVLGSTVTISQEGTYVLSGTLTDGQIVIDADDSAKIQLVLDGAAVTSSTSAAIYVKQADKVFITTAEGSENTLANGGSYVATDENSVDAVIFAKSDLTLNGSGTLIIQAAAGHGIVSKDDLVLASGTCVINAEKQGLSGKDSVRIAGGSYTITAGTDAIHSENDDAAKGFVYIASGRFTITAQGDGISGSSYVTLLDGQFTIVSGSGHTAAAAHFDNLGPNQAAADDTASTKGIKAGTVLTISGGSYDIDAADDALHADSTLTIDGGSFTIAAGDDGIHADEAVTINGGDVAITTSYEGIEGLSITLNDGTIAVKAADDGLNAAGGNDASGDMFAITDGAGITINGGTLTVDASGDGLDSNGSLYLNGGTVVVSGPTDNGNGTLDYNGEAIASGGTFLGTGSSGMAQNFSTASTQGCLLVSLAGSAGDIITVTDASGNVILTGTAAKAYTCVLVSSPDLALNGVYTITNGSASVTATLDSLVAGNGGGMNPGGNGGNMGPGGQGPRGH